LETEREREIGDPFRIASISKTFTATAILQLVDQGALRTGDPIAKWFPDFPNADAITVKDLLMMRSGVPEFADETVLGAYYERPLAPFTAQDAIASLPQKPTSLLRPARKPSTSIPTTCYSSRLFRK
jgi:D-alanyl-D-alanine carboxypeptidase